MKNEVLDIAEMGESFKLVFRCDCAFGGGPCAAVPVPYSSNKHPYFSPVLSYLPYMPPSPVRSFTSSSPVPQSQRPYPLSLYLSTLALPCLCGPITVWA